ncbi:MAG: DUF192 domain-containing protein [Phycisphaeraceae bacterium]|nr:DUF192 domain-containing protein [Phycisphaeraceae bacterium]
MERLVFPRLVLGLGLLLAALSACSRGGQAGEADTVSVPIGGQVYHLRLAMDPESRFKGLSDEPSLPADGGMLFVFPEPEAQIFVMRRCLFPIDLIFVSPTGRITTLHRMTVEPYETAENQLRRYPSRWAVQYAIELTGGQIDKLGLQEGQMIAGLPAELKQRAR